MHEYCWWSMCRWVLGLAGAGCVVGYSFEWVCSSLVGCLFVFGSRFVVARETGRLGLRCSGEVAESVAVVLCCVGVVLAVG